MGINDIDFVETSNMRVVYIIHVGIDSDNLNVYHFLLSEEYEETFAEGWGEKPACNTPRDQLMIEDSMFEYVKELKTTIKLDLAQDNCCFSMQDCRDKCVALASENLDQAEEYPDEGRIVIHFGDFIDDVEAMLAKRNLRMRFI